MGFRRLLIPYLYISLLWWTAIVFFMNEMNRNTASASQSSLHSHFSDSQTISLFHRPLLYVNLANALDSVGCLALYFRRLKSL